jgi:hypothetical protein
MEVEAILWEEEKEAARESQPDTAVIHLDMLRWLRPMKLEKQRGCGGLERAKPRTNLRTMGIDSSSLVSCEMEQLTRWLCVYRLIHQMHDRYILHNNGRSDRNDRKRIDYCRALQDVH